MFSRIVEHKKIAIKMLKTTSKIIFVLITFTSETSERVFFRFFEEVYATYKLKLIYNGPKYFPDIF